MNPLRPFCHPSLCTSVKRSQYQNAFAKQNPIVSTSAAFIAFWAGGRLNCLEQPDIPEQGGDKGKEDEPHLPSNTRTLCHAQHTVHSPLELITRIRELVIHLFRQSCRVADFVADAEGELCEHIVSLCPFLPHHWRYTGSLLTSFNMPTFLLISETCSSF